MPRIREIVLRNFTLFSLKRNIHEEVSKGVFCLAGANGIGKSTFLPTMNYGLTRIVLDPRQKFSSEEEYYQKNLEPGRLLFRKDRICLANNHINMADLVENLSSDPLRSLLPSQ